MLELIRIFWYITNKLKIILTPQILTLMLLVLILIRAAISNFVLVFLSKILGIESERRKRSTIKFIETFIAATALFLILRIWIKNSKLLLYMLKTYKIVVIFAITQAIAYILNSNGNLFKKLFNLDESNKLISDFISHILRVVTYIIGAFVIISELGYNLNGLAAGFGIGSAIMALAVQDVVKSILAGTAIISEKPFVIGDFIKIGDFSGRVQNITLRNTTIKNLSNHTIIIPNQVITKDFVINMSRIENRRIEEKLVLDNKSGIDKIRKVISKIKMVLETDEQILKETINVKISKITLKGVEISIYCYLVDGVEANYLNENEKLNIQILKILESENVELGKESVQNINISKEIIEKMNILKKN